MSKDVVNPEVLTATAASAQEAMDTVAASRRGQPTDDVFVALKAELAKRAVTHAISNEALRSYAAAIAVGREVILDPDDLEAQA
ncbi:MAG TPA: hypothetical protein VKI99_10510 [Candidatus Dormibacteraeota bacterium]|nr:hypothetical protein [Candidatus Dormibacteraeota bacterium]